MKRNVANLDRVVRLLLVIAVAALYLTHVIGGTLALLLGIVAVVLLLTSVVSWCPIYAALGLSTIRKPAPPAA